MLAQRAVRGSARMSGVQHGADGDDSKGFGTDRVRLPTVLTLRAGLAVAGLAGAVLLVVASFASVIEITVGTTARVVDADTAQSGWDRHGPALVLLGLLSIALLGAALRSRSRTAMGGLVACGLAALAIAWAADRPHLDDAGSVGDVYAEAEANPGTGYYLETLGGALVLLSGGALLVLGRMPVVEPAPASRRRETAARR
jgi:hypothetical protein